MLVRTSRPLIVASVLCAGCELASGLQDLSIETPPEAVDAGQKADAEVHDAFSGWPPTSKPQSCPDSLGGAALVAVRGGYCIDATEVTRLQYGAWIATNPSTDDQPSFCAWNRDFLASATCLAGLHVCKESCGDHPQVCVDWCDAYAYCRAMGKRLCGRIEGGACPFEHFAMAWESQWYSACSAGGQKEYPYGAPYEPHRCVGKDFSSTTTPVATATDCQIAMEGYFGVFDLSGNAAEWEDACNGEAGEADMCRVRGGSFEDGDSNASCKTPEMRSRSTTMGDIGFRCCAL